MTETEKSTIKKTTKTPMTKKPAVKKEQPLLDKEAIKKATLEQIRASMPNPHADADHARVMQADKISNGQTLTEEQLAALEVVHDAFMEHIKSGGVNPQDLERGLAYAKDLIGGLEMLRTFSQGVTVFGSARVDENNKYYQATRELGQKLAQNGHTVITGGGPGIMEAANRGAYEYGGRSIGLNITLDHEQFPNPYLTDVLEFRYFFARKVMLSMASKAYVFMPGGFGTMDEMTEIVILMQERKMPKMPVFLFGKSYWRPLEKFYRTRLLADKMIETDDLKIMRLTDDVDEIVAAANKIGHARVDENIYDTIKKAQK